MPLGGGHGRAPARIRWADDGPSTPAPGLRHLPGLDGLRGLAVVAVLLYHGDALRGGYLGVDAFFVLSGFLITSLLLAEISRSRRVDLAAFWSRRARRLLPALFVTLLGVAVFASLFASASDFERIRSDAFATLGYVANWHSIAGGHDYWSLFQAPSPLEHTWSLAIEEQFYLVWPLVVFAIAWFAARRARRRPEAPSTVPRTLFFLTAGLAVVSTGLMWSLYRPGDTARVYLGTDTRASGILMGAALAAWFAWRGSVATGSARRFALEAVAIGAGAFLLAAWATIDGESGFLYRGGFLLCGVSATAVIAAVAHPDGGPVARVLSFAPLRALGIISYGLYLWHWPVYIAMTSERVHLDGTALLAARIAVSLALATASFVLIERPIRRGVSFTGWRLAAAVPAAAAVCVVAIVTTTTGGTPSVAAVPLSAPAGPAIRNDPALVTAASRQPSAGPRILVLGDSVANQLGAAAEGIQTDVGVSVRRGAINGCVLADDVDGRRLATRTHTVPIEERSQCAPVWLAVERSFVPSTVVIVYGNTAAFEEVSVAGQWLAPCDPAYATWYETHLSDMVRTFTRKGESVRLALLAYPVGSYLRDDARARIDCVNALHTRLATAIPGVTTFDLGELVCPSGQCIEEFDGEKFRPDGYHFSKRAAPYVARWVLDEVQRAAAEERAGRYTMMFW